MYIKSFITIYYLLLDASFDLCEGARKIDLEQLQLDAKAVGVHNLEVAKQTFLEHFDRQKSVNANLPSEVIPRSHSIAHYCSHSHTLMLRTLQVEYVELLIKLDAVSNLLSSGASLAVGDVCVEVCRDGQRCARCGIYN